MRADRHLLDVLWDSKNNGTGFESGLAQIQLEALGGSPGSKEQLTKFEAALANMFADMDKGFAARRFEFQHQDSRRQIVKFLVRFPAIFTLNQDLLLERHYLDNNDITAVTSQRLLGAMIPGMRETRADPVAPYDVSKSRWEPTARGIEMPDRWQGYYKLQGSWRWCSGKGGQMMVMGC